jgi:hypothetical protein
MGDGLWAVHACPCSTFILPLRLLFLLESRHLPVVFYTMFVDIFWQGVYVQNENRRAALRCTERDDSFPCGLVGLVQLAVDLALLSSTATSIY